MSAAGLSATGSASASVYIPGPSSTSRRKSSTVSALAYHINRDSQHKFYIPGETPSGGPFPELKKNQTGSPSLTVTTDEILLTTGCNPLHLDQANHSQSSSLSNVWSFIQAKVWGLVQNTFKKGKLTKNLNCGTL